MQNNEISIQGIDDSIFWFEGVLRISGLGFENQKADKKKIMEKNRVSLLLHSAQGPKVQSIVFALF